MKRIWLRIFAAKIAKDGRDREFILKDFVVNFRFRLVSGVKGKGKKMKAGRFTVFMVVSLVFFGVSAAIAAENPAGSVFKDPYNGGIKLPNGGGEPGNAYMAFIKALYSKNHMRICKLMADPAEVPQCLQQKQALDSYIAMFTQPISHKVLGGFMQGEEATLNVAYNHKGAPQNTGFVVMKKAKNRWVMSSSGGSGSANVSASASATMDLASGSSNGKCRCRAIAGGGIYRSCIWQMGVHGEKMTREILDGHIDIGNWTRSI